MPPFAGIRRGIRSVLQALAGLLGRDGGGARDEISALNVEMRSERIDPDEDDVVRVEVSIPESATPADRPIGSAALLGVSTAFERSDGSVRVADEDLVAAPAEVADFENPHQHGKLMAFRTDEVVPKEERGKVAVGLGVFPNGATSPIPTAH